MSAPPARAGEILDFWFGAPGDPVRGGFRKAWFERSDAFDEEIRRRFLADVEEAAAGARDAWAATPEGALALLILLDQFPRNLFRGDARAFAADARARAVADAALARGHDCAVGPVERVFFCLPFEHSEALADQDRSVALFEAIPERGGYTAEVRAMAIRAAHRHREIVARFGRFPHRNEALGRATTAAEAAFLRESNSSF